MRSVALVLLLCAPAGAQQVRMPSRGIVWIPAGEFLRGATPEDVDYAVRLCQAAREPAEAARCAEPLFLHEMPARRIHLSRYGIDRTEVTVGAWRRCVLAGSCAPARTRESDPRLATDDRPVTGVTYEEAADYCDFVGGRLPTEAEWERAARGDDGRRFPWGDLFNERLANHGNGRGPRGVDGFRHAAPVASYPDAVSPHGLFDMAGNVWEWTADGWDEASYSSDLSVDPRGPGPRGERMVRGGSWRASPELLRTTARVPVPAGESAPDLGFRCAYR